MDEHKSNLINIYGARDWEHINDFMNAMLMQAHKLKTSSNFKPIKVDLEQDISLWNLVTKYYEAVLEVKHFLDFDLKLTSDRIVDQVLAIVILWDKDDKDGLSNVLECFSESSPDSRLVVVEVDADLLEEDHEWHDICFEYGFECHSIFNLSEASMSWQCCSWPSIQIKPPAISSHRLSSHSEFGDKLNSTSLNPDEDYIQRISEDFKNSFEENPDLLLIKSDEDGVEETGFEDDFSPFVSGETSSTEWNYKNLSDNDDNDNESIKSLIDVEGMKLRLFGRNGESNETLEDVESVVRRIDQLRVEAASLDDRSRQRFAAEVALAFESQLCSN